MKKPFQQLSKEQQGKLQKKSQPQWLSPMLAKLTHETFSDAEWIFERKLDGERCLVYKKGKNVKLFSRNQKELGNTYPELVEALSAQEGNFIMDSEIVAFDGKVTSFSELQKRMHLKNSEEIKNSKTKVYLYVFDLIYLEDYQLTHLPLLGRKKLLKNQFQFADPLRFTAHRNENGEEYLKEACEKYWEGLIAKKANSSYVGNRSSHWLKFKCVNQQEFVIGGYTKPQGKRIGFGAILIGFYEDEKLHYAGKVGTGYNHKTLKLLHGKFKKLEVKENPFIENKTLATKKAHWLKPKLVAEIGFTEWTSTNKLRHPRYLGLRDDKPAKKVVKEA